LFGLLDGEQGFEAILFIEFGDSEGFPFQSWWCLSVKRGKGDPSELEVKVDEAEEGQG